VAVTQHQKIDFLLKKIGYTKTKTGLVVDSTDALSGTEKFASNETIASPLVIPEGSIWSESNWIPATPPTSDTAYVGVYTGATAFRLTVDSTVTGNRAYIPYTTHGDDSSAQLGNWVDTQFGNDYQVAVYANHPDGRDGSITKLPEAGSGSNDAWFFDYSAGTLNFNDTNVPSQVSAGGTNIYVVGYRYKGRTGVQPPGGIGTFHNLYVSGLSTFVGVGTFNSHLYVGGNLDIKGSVTLGHAATDNVVFNADVDSNIIPDDNNTYDLGSNSQRWKKIYVNNVGIGTSTVISDDITTRHLKVTGIGTFDTNVNVGGASTFTGLVDINGGGQANTFKVEDLTQYRVVLAGSGGEIEDNSKLTFDPASNLNVTGGLTVSGITTLGSVGISTGLITGPANMYIDPATVGDDTGTLVIKGNLQVDGTQTTVNSTTMDVADKNVGIASGAANDAAADGAGITVYSGQGNKTFNWVDATDSWTSSENFDLASGKVFKINTTSVLSNDTLGSGVVNSRLTSVDTLNHLKVAGITTLTGSIITGVTTITQLQVGTTGQTLVGITTILDEDDMASDSAAALVTQQSIKKYVDDQVTAQDLDITTDSGTIDIDLDSDTLSISGTANEIETSATGEAVTIGLPNDVTIGNDLTVTGDIASVVNVNVTGVSTFTDNIDANAGLDVDGTSDLDQVNIAQGLNVTAGIATFAADIDANADMELAGNLAVTGVSTFTDNIDANGNLDVDGQTDLDVLNVSDTATFTGNIDANGDLDVDGFTELDDLNVSGITTTVSFSVGTTGQTLVGITTILDEDNMASNSATALVTQQSVKAYVDNSAPGGSALQVSADSGSNQFINLSADTLDIEGTANEIETITGSDKVIIGLPDDVTIGNNLTVTGKSTLTKEVGIGSALTVAGVSTFSGVVNSNAGLNVTAGISTFAELINATKSIQGNENLVVTGISTLTSNTYIGTAGTVFTALVGAAASVGIGSATPDYMLDVAGTINSETDVKIQGVSVTTQALNDAVAMAIALG